MKKLILLIILLLCWTFASPVYEFKSNVQKNPQWIAESMEGIKKEVSKYALPNGVVGIAIKDLNSGETFSLNGNMAFHPASVMKIPVMIEAYHQDALGVISLDDKMRLSKRFKLTGSGSLQYHKDGEIFTIRRLIDLMITDSDNTATYMLVEKLGIKNINSYMRRCGIYRTVLKDPTMLCKEDGKHNVTSPEDMLKLMDKMYKGQLVNAKASTEMLAVMKAQRHKWGIARFLPNVTIANKTGSLDFVRNDVGIIYANNKPYIISIFSKGLPSNSGGSVMIGSLSKVIYDVRNHIIASSKSALIS
ncbi:MAG: class A beta-lactamase-related serine hydrolase [Candidatus Margulisbacteria bacterium]|nr:class A beta-lactamase-related serine hydrolase [Candidatus Margulisiibacteriota bacterium]